MTRQPEKRTRFSKEQLETADRVLKAARGGKNVEKLLFEKTTMRDLIALAEMCDKIESDMGLSKEKKSTIQSKEDCILTETLNNLPRKRKQPMESSSYDLPSPPAPYFLPPPPFPSKLSIKTDPTVNVKGECVKIRQEVVKENYPTMQPVHPYTSNCNVNIEADFQRYYSRPIEYNSVPSCYIPQRDYNPFIFQQKYDLENNIRQYSTSNVYAEEGSEVVYIEDEYGNYY